MYIFIYLLFISRRGQLLSYYIIRHVNLFSDWPSYFSVNKIIYLLICIYIYLLIYLCMYLFIYSLFQDVVSC